VGKDEALTVTVWQAERPGDPLAKIVSDKAAAGALQEVR
jgi:hypothetical protein